MVSRIFRNIFRLEPTPPAPPTNPQARAALWEACRAERATPDRRIASWTAIIQSKNEIASDRVIALNYRGMARRSKGDLDQAIADHTEAIRLDPSQPAAYFSRGRIFADKG